MAATLIAERARAIGALPDFASPSWWLTFYLTAEPARLEDVASRLIALGAVNLGGSESGFIYPKLRVSSEPDQVVKLVAAVQQLAAASAVEVISVDVDVSAEVERSSFKELVRFNPDVG